MLNRKFIHLIPVDGIGGVEVAAKLFIPPEDLHFSVEFLAPESDQFESKYLSIYTHALKKVVSLIKNPPAILIVSLWKAYLVGILVKLLRPSVRLVVFLHLPSHSHFLDFIFTKVAVLLASAIWADSEATRINRVARIQWSRTQVISFMTREITPLEVPVLGSSFIFWGRIHPQKGLVRAVKFFSSIYREFPDSTFKIIGPDGGDLLAIRNLIDQLGLGSAVTIYGPMAFEEIVGLAKGTCFYLQTSYEEGMAMSIVEAMRLGIVPVVTPVGQVNYYCVDMENSIVIRDFDNAVKRVCALVTDQQRFLGIRARAIGTWNGSVTYNNDITRACREQLLEVDVNYPGNIGPQ
jgi:glycosyltransferase involved in cell wall biosynthesis